MLATGEAVSSLKTSKDSLCLLMLNRLINSCASSEEVDTNAKATRSRWKNAGARKRADGSKRGEKNTAVT